MDPKLIAIYFPQFHSIPENNIWWGKDFTDWNLVKNAKPLFQSHQQPKIPFNNNYYNPCKPDVLQRQVEMAKDYGIYGFMFYHYWFDGKLILEKPIETFLQHKEMDLHFSLSWANASWTRQWLGNNEILLEQKHLPEKKLWKMHFDYLLPFFKDKRYIYIDGKPIFSIFCPDIIKHDNEMFNYWNELAITAGLIGIYYIAMKSFNFPKPQFLQNYDAVLKFQPRETNNLIKKGKVFDKKMFRLLPERIQLYLGSLKRKFSSYTYILSTEMWESILKNAYINDYKKYKLEVFESAYFSWDNTARYGKRAIIYSELTAKQKKEYLTFLYEKAKSKNSSYIFFNAWNEWSESAYLEPDEKSGFENLEIVKSIFGKI